MDPLSGNANAIVGIGRVIQLSVAPVFLLAGVGATLNVLVGRLVRIVERARGIEAQIAAADERSGGLLVAQLQLLAKRARLINRAVTFAVVCAILVPIVVICLFIDALFGVRLDMLLAAEFITALASLAVGLIYFLREVFIATATLTFSLPTRRPGAGSGAR